MLQLDKESESNAGELLRRALDLEFALDAGVRMGLDEIPADEFVALRIIREERSKLEKENAQAQQ